MEETLELRKTDWTVPGWCLPIIGSMQMPIVDPAATILH
jgi:hypothetical protein